MTKKLLIDSRQPEETRVVLLNGNRIEDFDQETTTKTQNKGNIYLARVTRVEPSIFRERTGNSTPFPMTGFRLPTKVTSSSLFRKRNYPKANRRRPSLPSKTARMTTLLHKPDPTMRKNSSPPLPQSLSSGPVPFLPTHP